MHMHGPRAGDSCVGAGSVPHMRARLPGAQTNNIRGQYYVPLAVADTPNALARNATLADELWTFSEDFIAAALAKL